jgi:hypothetical protein
VMACWTRQKQTLRSANIAVMIELFFNDKINISG